MTIESNNKPNDDAELQNFLEKYEDGLERRYLDIKTATPIHPVTGEVGIFIRFLRHHPIYQTPSGKLLTVQHGIPKSITNLNE